MPDPDLDTGAVLLDTGLDTDGSCAPALALAPAHDQVNIWRTVSFEAEGGTGAHRFSLAAGDSTAEVDPHTGRLLAGGEEGTLSVRLTDDGCEGEATASVEVVGAFSPAPLAGVVPAGVQFDFEPVNTIGALDCVLSEAGSGAGLDGCTYTSGAVEGFDRVRLTDTATGDAVTAQLHVVPGASLDLHGEQWWLPLGGALVPYAEGGTGHLEVSVGSGSILALDGDTVVGQEPGTERFTVRDRFTNQSAVIVAHVAAPVVLEVPRDGEDDPPVVSVSADWNGDGHADIAVASTGLRLSGAHSGGAYLFEGTGDGFDAAPAWEWDASAGTNAELGSSLAAGDADGDGTADLVVGSEDASGALYRNGTVALFLGGSGGLGAEPDQLVVGGTNYDALGESVGMCDLDGDGYADLIAGAPGFDVSGPDGNITSGALVVLPGSASGFDEFRRSAVTGVIDESGVWADADVDLGFVMRTGDLDGDGLCDVVAGSPLIGEGLVFGYLGDSASMLSTSPAFQLHIDDSHETENSDYFGEALATGGGWLAVGMPRYDLPSGNGGRVMVFSADSLLSTGGAIAAEDAVVHDIQGDSSNAYLGASLDWGALGGEEGLLVGAPTPTWTDGDGALWWVAADALDSGTADAVASVVAEGTLGLGDRIGVTALLVDGLAATFAGNDDTHGLDAGAPWVIGADGAVSVLEYPGLACESGVGEALASFDADGDGFDDLVFGVPGASPDAWGLDAGELWVCFGNTDTLCDGTPEAWALDWRTDTPREAFLGRHVATGDVDGDGVIELLALSTHAHQPSDAASDCGDGTADVGAVFVLEAGASVPEAVAYGVLADGEPDRVLTGFDFNGDGYTDFAFGGEEYGTSDTGAVSVVLGGPHGDGSSGPPALCPALTVVAGETDEAFGREIVSLGDVDGDGCDDLAASSPDADMGNTNQGAFRVLWGGGGDCGQDPAVSNFWPNRDDSINLGLHLAAGGDLDGDGVPDLVLNADGDSESNYQGILWLVPGSLLQSAARVPVADLDTVPDEHALPPTDLSALPSGYIWTSEVLGVPLNGSLALVEDWSSPGDWLVALEMPEGILGTGYGGAWVLGFDASEGAWDTVPRGVLAGEPGAPGALGETLLAPPERFLAGAPLSDVDGADAGAVYAFPSEAP